jgi:D-cysteine desulfhydrase
MPASLVSTWPRLGERLAPVSLGVFPTPVERLAALEREFHSGPLYVKRDDRSSPIYGGNKVRTLEVLFGLARAQGANEIVAVGPYGSNQAVATALHAPSCGLVPAAILFAQPASLAALANLRVIAARCPNPVALPHWSFVPAAMWRAREKGRFVMAPGGATPDGALGYVAAGLELAGQIARRELEPPSAIYVPVGSTCTAAGLLVGLVQGARLGFGAHVPRVVAVRVTPWPVTSRLRILSLAVRASRRLAQLAGAPLELRRDELAKHLRVDGRELGRGYGFPTAEGLAASELLAESAGLRIDPTYSAKAAAAFVRAAREKPSGPLLFWSTKSSAPLPEIGQHELPREKPRLLAWVELNERRASATQGD